MDNLRKQVNHKLINYAKKRFPYFDFDSFNETEVEYFIYHYPRFEYLISKVQSLINDYVNQEIAADSKVRILDIGPHFLTQIIRNETDAIVDQLGWRYDSVSKPRNYEKHIEFDLTNCVQHNRLFDYGGYYDIITACEVIEHIYISPDYVFSFLGNLLNKGGYLIIGTPNAVSLKKRLLMLTGRNPYELIRTTIDNPGHFREYTKNEIIDYAERSFFRLVDFNCSSIFNYINHGITGRLYKIITNILPQGLRDNMTLIFMKV